MPRSDGPVPKTNVDRINNFMLIHINQIGGSNVWVNRLLKEVS